MSENSVPLNPMVNDNYPYSMAISLGIYPIFRQTHVNVYGDFQLRGVATSPAPPARCCWCRAPPRWQARYLMCLFLCLYVSGFSMVFHPKNKTFYLYHAKLNLSEVTIYIYIYIWEWRALFHYLQSPQVKPRLQDSKILKVSNQDQVLSCFCS